MQEASSGFGGRARVAFARYDNAGSGAGVYSFDVRVPSNLAVLDVESLSSLSLDFGGVAFDSVKKIGFAVGGSRLLSFNAVDPANISLITSYAVSYGAMSNIALDTANSVAFVTGSGFVAALDVSDPSSPVELSSYADASVGGTIRVDLTSEVAYVVRNSSNRITAIDVSDPSNLSRLGFYANNTTLRLPDVVEIDTANQVAFVAGGDDDVISWLTAIDISDPTNMTEISTQTQAPVDGANDIFLDRDAKTLYVAWNGEANRDSYLDAWDVNDVSTLTKVLRFEVGGLSTLDLNSIVVDERSKTLFGIRNDTTRPLISYDVSDLSNVSVVDSVATNTVTGRGVGRIILDIDGPASTQCHT